MLFCSRHSFPAIQLATSTSSQRRASSQPPRRISSRTACMASVFNGWRAIWTPPRLRWEKLGSSFLPVALGAVNSESMGAVASRKQEATGAREGERGVPELLWKLPHAPWVLALQAFVNFRPLGRFRLSGRLLAIQHQPITLFASPCAQTDPQPLRVGFQSSSTLPSPLQDEPGART
jgi:hypothetical protein